MILTKYACFTRPCNYRMNQEEAKSQALARLQILSEIVPRSWKPYVGRPKHADQAAIFRDHPDGKFLTFGFEGLSQDHMKKFSAIMGFEMPSDFLLFTNIGAIDHCFERSAWRECLSAWRAEEDAQLQHEAVDKKLGQSLTKAPPDVAL